MVLSVFGSMGTFDSVGVSEEPPGTWIARATTVLISWKIAHNLWPDEWTDPWPACPAHGDHPSSRDVARQGLMGLLARQERWSVGSLDGTFPQATPIWMWRSGSGAPAILLLWSSEAAA